ncbi:MAG: hypothetical protein ACRDNI_00110 [Gaiellaceae bacterium]
MERRRRRRFAATAVVGLALACAGTAAADPFSGWTGKRGPFAWEAKLLACGNVGDSPSRVRAHTRWRRSPGNGYVRLTFFRQVLGEDGDWVTVQKQTRSTRNGQLEGASGAVHWSQWFFPFEDESGATTRHSVRFEWLRDRTGRPDRRMLRRVRTLPACIVAP